MGAAPQHLGWAVRRIGGQFVLHRQDPAGLVVIAQPAHAWVSGQLARAWGNERFGRFEPREEVCLGAEQHDNGWAEWEAAPTLNPRTGRPTTFVELTREAHLAIWSAAARRTLAQGRYPALLVSLHGSGLYARYDPAGDPPEAAQAVREFLAREQAFQAEVVAGLRADPHYAPFATPEVIGRNRRLVAVWDGMSLALCGGLRAERSLAGVPTAGGETALTLRPVAGDPTQVVVDPWPFSRESVTLVCEGRRLPETFAAEATMRAALARAPWLTIVSTLRPA